MRVEKREDIHQVIELFFDELNFASAWASKAFPEGEGFDASLVGEAWADEEMGGIIMGGWIDGWMDGCK